MSAARAASLCGLLSVLAITVCLSSAPAGAELSCRDEEGNPVDWFIAYKFPKVVGDEKFGDGHAYSYITSDDVNQEVEEKSDRQGDLGDPESSVFLHQFKNLLIKFAGGFSPKKTRPIRKTKKGMKPKSSRWEVSDRLISDPGSAIMRTLAPAYEEKSGISSVFYNDDPSGTDSLADEDDPKPNMRRAHAKGVFLMDDSADDGVWLTHSIPRFPPVRKEALNYPKSGRDFGQTLMCVSIDLKKSGNQLVNHLFNMRPLVYDRQVTRSLLIRFPNLNFLDLEEKIKGKRLQVEPNLAQTITTRGGQMINLFSKSMSFNKDLWQGWIDDALGADLNVQTWRRGSGGVLNSTCPSTGYHVNNIQDLRYDNNIKWSYIKDHSKWAISDEESLSTVCIGDSNRVESQFRRGGGAVCMKCASCWSVFSDTILDTEPCPIRSGEPKKRVTERSLVEKIKETLYL